MMPITEEVGPTGELGLSHPTDNAMQALNPELIKRYKVLYVNLRTLFRNAVNVLTKGGTFPSEASIAERLREDYTTLQAWASNQGLWLVFYYNTHKSLQTGRLKTAQLKIPKTSKQLEYADSESNWMSFLVKEGYATMLIDTPLYPADGVDVKSALVLTHYPSDLIQHYRFDDVLLVESHTGQLKPPSLLGTKLNIKPEYKNRIPFNEITLMLFGDNVLVTGQTPALKNAAQDIAVKSGWNGTTTFDRTFLTLNENPLLRDWLRYALGAK